MENKKKLSKTDRILSHLKSGGTITQLDATYEFGTTRLSSIIFNLRKRGYAIESMETYGTDRFGGISHFVKYRLIGGLKDE